MLRYAIIFLLVAILAAIFGFGGIAADAVWIARVLCFVFLALFAAAVILGRRTPPAG